ncbi:response regulator transcription factor [Luteibacter sp.]|uniref:response regulator transcription factor n=1 Tax=Luteibacter sp. TaxID=1886636 RepID=UPI003F7F5441
MANRQTPWGQGASPDTLLDPHIVVVEDDELYRDTIVVPALADFGFRVTAIGTAGQLERVLDSDTPDIVVLDVGLPDGDGFAITERLSQNSTVGIVILSGRDTQHDRLRGLTNGADAYLSKPVVMHELATTLRNLMRRLRPGHGSPAPAPSWRLDSQGWSLYAPNGSSVALKAYERSILRALFEVPGEPVPRESLITALGGDELFDPHRIEVLVYRLRSKVAKEAGLVLPLNAVRGSGYVFAI